MTTIQYVSPKTPAQMNYESYLHSFRWRGVVRPIRLWLDGYRCRVCQRPSQKGNPLNVHHTPVAYKFRGHSGGSMLDVVTHLSDVLGEIYYTITLCQEHHHAIHED